jgi:hypothetical protein
LPDGVQSLPNGRAGQVGNRFGLAVFDDRFNVLNRHADVLGRVLP